jgi:hypothetical protein
MLARIMPRGLLAIVLLCGLALPTQANDRNFKVINSTNDTIQSLWLSTASDSEWHRVRGLENLDDGGSADVSFDNSGPCRVQLRVVMDNGSAIEFTQGFDLCNINTIRLYFNKQGTMVADYD